MLNFVFYRSIGVLLIVLIGFSTNILAQATDSEQPNAELKKFKDWNVQCVRNNETNKKACVLFHQLTLDDGRVLMAFQVQKIAPREETNNATHVAVLTVPLGVHLPSGIRVQVDEGDPLDLIYERCDQGGCYAGITLDEKITTTLKKGTEGIVQFNNLNGDTVSAKISLSGFTAGYNSL